MLVLNDLTGIRKKGRGSCSRRGGQRTGRRDEGSLMIVRAAGRFGCAHRWVATATDDGAQWLLVCEGCGHRTEQLPLTRDTSFGQVLAFPSPSVEAGISAERMSSRHPRSLIQSA